MKRKWTISTFIVITIGVMSKAIGFVRDMFVAMFLGAGIENDAFQVAQTLPLTVFGSIALSVTTLYVTMYEEIRRKFGENEALRFSNRLLMSLAVVSLALTAFGIVGAPLLVSIFAPGFSANGKALAIDNTRLAFVGVAFHFYIAVACGYLNYKGKFFLASAKGIFMNIGLLVFFAYLLVVGEEIVSIHSLVTMILLGLCLHALVLTWHMVKNGYTFFVVSRPIFDEHMKKFFRLLVPIMLGVSIIQLAPICDRMIASFLEEGSVSALSYGGRLTLFGGSIVAAGMLTIVYPQIVRWIQRGEKSELHLLVRQYFLVFQSITIPMASFIFVQAKPLVTFLFGRGNFDERDVAMTVQVVTFLAVALPIYGMRELYVKMFHALQDTRTPVRNGIVVVMLNIVFSVVFSRFFAVGGIALGTSLSLWLMTIVLHVQLQKRLFHGRFVIPWKEFWKIVASSAIAAAVSSLGSRIVAADSLLTFIGSLFVFGAVYIGCSFVMNASWVKVAKQLLRRKTASH